MVPLVNRGVKSLTGCLMIFPLRQIRQSFVLGRCGLWPVLIRTFDLFLWRILSGWISISPDLPLTFPVCSSFKARKISNCFNAHRTRSHTSINLGNNDLECILWRLRGRVRACGLSEFETVWQRGVSCHYWPHCRNGSFVM
jgi:hypothetical protein